MKGFNRGVTIVFKTVTILVNSNEFCVEGLTCRKMVEPYQIITTVRWEEQVKKALLHSLSDGIVSTVERM